MEYSSLQKIYRRLGGSLDKYLLEAAWNDSEVRSRRGHAATLEALDRIESQSVENSREKGAPDIERRRKALSGELRKLIQGKGFDQKALQLSKCLAALSVGDLDAYLVHTLAEKAVYRDTLRTMNATLGEFLVLHMTCVSRLDRANASVQSFKSVDESLTHLLIVGGGSESEYRYDERARVLHVPTGDEYEFLAQKMVLALSLLARLPRLKCILKVDDDHRLKNGDALLRAFARISRCRRPQYGNIIRAHRYGDHSRAWHMGKCSDSRLTSQPFQSFGALRWCDGASGYFVNRLGMRAANWAHLYFRHSIEHALYEDMFISEMFAKVGGGIGKTNMRDIVGAIEIY